MPDVLQELYPEQDNYGNEIYSKSAYRMEELGPNHIMIADNKLLDEVYEQ
ncbi:hypothetical protein C808_01963 [Lachnospiraceae bacterium M18-1]|nr:hypothetical protein C808_01963 [Lachnospiraceae bacterium M18-1]